AGRVIHLRVLDLAAGAADLGQPTRPVPGIDREGAAASAARPAVRPARRPRAAPRALAGSGAAACRRAGGGRAAAVLGLRHLWARGCPHLLLARPVLGAA